MNVSLRTGFSDSIRGARKMMGGDLRLLLANAAENLKATGRGAAILFLGGVISLVGAVFALVFAYVGIAELTGGAYAWTALGFAVLFGGLGGTAIVFAIYQMKRVDFTQPEARRIIAEHAEIYPDFVRRAGRQAVRTLQEGVQIFSAPAENSRAEAKLAIHEGQVLWESGRPAREAAKHDLHVAGTGTQLAFRILPWAILGFFAHEMMADRRALR